MEDPSKHKPSLLERLSAMLLREPEDREELITLLHSAFERNLLDAEALAMIEGVLEVSDLTARDVMVPRSQMDVIRIDDPIERLLPDVLRTGHSRFPVIGDNKDDVLGILLAKDLLHYFHAPARCPAARIPLQP
jgi:magnesium and cobalt transporter